MENAQNKRRSTRGAAVPLQTFPSSSAIKNETPDAYGSRGQTRQPIMGSFQEASSSNSNDDPLAVEVDIGGTSITFHDPYFDMQTNYIKTEGIAADEIEDINDAVGSSTKRRKTMDDDDSGDDLELARSVQQPMITLASIVNGTFSQETSLLEKVQRMTEIHSRQINKLTKMIVGMKAEIALLKSKVCSTDNVVLKPKVCSTDNVVLKPKVCSTDTVVLKPFRPAFVASLVSTREELDALEAHLAETPKFWELHIWLSSEINSTQSLHRMHDALYMLFDPSFLTQCSWSGRGQKANKIPFKNYQLVFQVLRSIAKTDDETVVPAAMVEDFIKTKLCNAKSAARATGMIRRTAKRKFLRKKTVASLDMVLGDTLKFPNSNSV